MAPIVRWSAALAFLAALAAGCKKDSAEPTPQPSPSVCSSLMPVAGLEISPSAWIASLAPGDLDGDGRVDLAAGRGTGDRVDVLRGKGDGTFEPGPSLEVGAGPAWGLAVAHLDGDAYLDLVVANSGDDTISVLRGAAAGAFLPRVDLPTGARPVHVVAADLDGDGKRDLVVAHYDGGSVGVFRGNGDGTFQPREDHPVLTRAAMISVGDVNGDQRPDLLVPDDVAGAVRVLLGATGGTFTSGGNVSVTGGAVAIALADLDGDGKLDLAVTDGVGAGVAVLPGRGDGTFGAWTKYPTGQHPRALTSTDLDGDGWKDLVLVNAWDETLTVLPGRDGGGFGPAVTRLNGISCPAGLVVADLDGDRRDDLVVLNDRFPNDPLYDESVLTANRWAFTIAPFLNRCDASLVVDPLRATVHRGGAPVRFSASLAGVPTEVTWSIAPSVGALSATSGVQTDYTGPAAPGGREALVVSAAGAAGTARAWAHVSALTAHAIGTSGTPSGYLEYLPPGYGDGAPRPLLVYLHGSGAEGDGDADLHWVASWNPVPALIGLGEWPASRPFVVLAPQQHSPASGCFTAAEVHDFLAWAISHYDVDPKRVYLAGWSCGAMAIWEYLGWYADTQVAAVVPVAGDPGVAWSRKSCDLGKVAIWAIHGVEDRRVLPGPTQTIMTSLASCPAPLRPMTCTMLPRRGHGVAADVFTGTAGLDVYAWMLANGKP